MNPNLYIESPVYRSHHLKEEQNKNVFYKMDCHQPTGSFKIRGMEYLCRYHFERGERNFVASSGGNAGYSLAYVGKYLGIYVKVVVPETTSDYMIEKIQSLGAEVEVFGRAWDEAHEHALQVASDIGAIYVSPFDDPLLWKGHSSIIDECARQISQPDKIIVSVGGGGLLCGVLEGMERNGWKDTQVITTETLGAASFYESFKANRLVELKEITSIATSLGAKKVAEKSLEWARRFQIRPFTLSDNKALDSCVKFLDEYSVLVEPACGAALSVPYFYSDMIDENENVLVIVCGGVNTQLRALRDRL